MGSCACIPPWFWDLPETQRAVVDQDPSELIRLLRQHTDLSQTALARMAGISQPLVSGIISNKTAIKTTDKAIAALGRLVPPPSATVLTAWPLQQPTEVAKNPPPETTGLGDLFTESTADAIHLSTRFWNADLHQSHAPDALHIDPEHLSVPLLRWLVAPPALLATATARTAPEVTHGDVAAITRACDLFEALDHEFGGGHARTAAVQYLHSEVGPLLRGRSTPDVGRALFSASARFAAKTGAMAYDAGLHALGRRYFLQSLNLAHLAGDRLLGAKALALLSHQANFLGHYRSSIDLARTAKTGIAGQATPAVRAMLAAMEARGLASLGDQASCTRALHEMEDAFQQVNSATEPAWMRYFDASELSDELAHCFHDLGQGRHAIDHAQQSVVLSPAGFQRSRAFAGLIHAGAHLKQAKADPEAACGVAREAIVKAGTLRSARVRTYITRLRSELEPYADTRHVREFDEFLADAPLIRP
jgi:transcriptional regulator with XRE-family HTH domain